MPASELSAGVGSVSGQSQVSLRSQVRQKVSKSVMLQVEKGIERFSYAKRWKDIISKGHRDIPSCGTPETDPTPADNSEGASPEDVIPPTSQAQRPSTTGVGAAETGDG